nr:RecX family transcriptional regulator [Nocardioidaceae bacterium]
LARRALAQELRQRGVDDEVARAALDRIDPEHEVDLARSLVRQKLRSTRGLERQARVRRLAAMLARRGYPPGIAIRVVREEIATDGEDAGDFVLD